MALSVCVLGGTGFIGRSLVARLAADGHRVKVLTRDRAGARDLLVLPTVRLVRADVHDPGVLEREFNGCAVVVNLVGILNERRPGHGSREFRRVHTELPMKVVAACRAAGVQRYLHMSGLKADSARGPSHYLRSKGEATKTRMIAEADRNYTEKVAEARKQAEILRGEGDAGRNKEFAKAFQQDPEFFAFYRSLQAYGKALANRDTTLVLNPDSEFFKYFGADGKDRASPGRRGCPHTQKAPAIQASSFQKEEKSCIRCYGRNDCGRPPRRQHPPGLDLSLRLSGFVF